MNTISPTVASTKHGIILILAAIMPVMAVISLVPVLPMLLEEFKHISGYEVLVPIAMTIPALCVAVFSPIAGSLSDKFGRKSLLIFALLIYSAVGVLPYFLESLSHIIVSRIFLGITEAVIMTIATALIADYFIGKERQKWISIQIASVSLSAIFLIALGGMLGEVLGSRGPFVLYLLALPVALLVALNLFEPKVRANEDKQLTGFPVIKVLPLLFITLFVGIIFYSMIVKLGEVLSISQAVTPAIIGGIGALANIGVALGAFCYGKIKHISGPLLLCVGFGLSAFGYFATAVSSSIVISSIAIFIGCLGFGSLLPTTLTWVLKLLPENVRGKGTGMWTGMFFLGQFTAPIVVTLLQKTLDSLSAVLVLIAICCAIASLVAALKSKGARDLKCDDTNKAPV
ncbi:MFS transporter [Pseudoalteromonas sp. SG43-1]|uniref:MFS transporter n=1 Tax=Pseudoalteromonas sp. SG43-1 TaxID=2760971 RepID=UPI001600E13E|nr:MFS transporter [Pseudoalteromonas sp. SG43-1]MBB1450668.1 MFS transporter [Pseudoalteromonas sp. SG43-1]